MVAWYFSLISDGFYILAVCWFGPMAHNFLLKVNVDMHTRPASLLASSANSKFVVAGSSDKFGID